MATEVRDDRPPMELKDRVRELRRALKLTQGELAIRTEGALDSSYINKIESGKNKASTVKVREALARGFWLPSAALSEYLDGEADLETTLKLVKHPNDSTHSPFDDTPPNIIESAIAKGFVAERMTLKAMDFVRSALSGLTNERLPLEFSLITWEKDIVEAVAELMRQVTLYPPKDYVSHGEDTSTWPEYKIIPGHWPELRSDLLLLMLAIDMTMKCRHYEAQIRAGGGVPVPLGMHHFWGHKFIMPSGKGLERFFTDESPLMSERPGWSSESRSYSGPPFRAPHERITELHAAIKDGTWPVYRSGIPSAHAAPDTAHGQQRDPDVDEEDKIPF